MGYRYFMWIVSAVHIALGVATVAAPSIVWQPYGITDLAGTSGATMSHLLGPYLLMIGVMCFTLRNEDPSTPAVRALLAGLLIYAASSFVVTLLACVQGVFKGLGWLDPAMFAGISVWLYFLLRGTRRAQA